MLRKSNIVLMVSKAQLSKSEGFAQDEHGCCAAPNHFILIVNFLRTFS